ncbi:MAG: alanine dehydrogenase [Proteobacteria bacterium]|nr:alanine dehydrogenase [Pseudomonadota bacterium]MCH9758058.1 alanine dehydrogenase [Pseudomonadota bacterium]
MKIGIPKEIKNHEYRVGMTPESVAQAVAQKHTVMVQSNAGIGIGASDADYKRAGAKIGKDAKTVFNFADMIVKVKEPLAPERRMLRPGQILFTYLHLAADKVLTQELLKSKAICIAYETITDSAGRLPLLAPMSKVAGRLAAQAIAHYLQRSAGGAGKLIGGVPGVLPAKVLVLGGGVVGRNAARIAFGMGADVTILERSATVMDDITVEFNGNVRTLYSSSANIARLVAESDAVVGGILLPGAAAPKLITEAMIKTMRPGSVIVDVAIDQGGCIATAKATTHDKPVYMKHGVVHYCVANMPGAVPHTSTYALNNVTLPFALKIAGEGWQRAVKNDPHLLQGLSVVEGALTCADSARSLKIKHTPYKL